MEIFWNSKDVITAQYYETLDVTVLCTSKWLILFIYFLNVCLYLREREITTELDWGRGRETGDSEFKFRNCQHRAGRRAQTHQR